MSANPKSTLSPGQIQQFVFDEPNDALRVIGTQAGGAIAVITGGSGFTPPNYDEVVLTYVPSGNGVGQIGTVTYKLATVTVETLTLTYDGSNRLIDVLKS